MSEQEKELLFDWLIENCAHMKYIEGSNFQPCAARIGPSPSFKPTPLTREFLENKIKELKEAVCN